MAEFQLYGCSTTCCVNQYRYKCVAFSRSLFYPGSAEPNKTEWQNVKIWILGVNLYKGVKCSLDMVRT
jgi:hypothetical protein